MKIEFEVEATHPFDLDHKASRYIEQLKEEAKRYPASDFKRIGPARVILTTNADNAVINRTWEATYEASFDI